MSDVLLLRFRDLVGKLDSIAEHNQIAGEAGYVLWGWWNKPLEATPDPGLTMFARDLLPGQTQVFLIDSATRKMYRAPLFEVHYEPGAPLRPAPSPAQCPAYYREKELPAWFKIGRIEPIPITLNLLEGYIWSRNNRTSQTRSISSLPDSAIGEDVVDLEFLDSNVSLWFITPKDEVGIPGRSKYVQPLSKGTWPTAGRYAIHLSDLHYGPKHSYRNQLAHGLQVSKETMVEALLEDFHIVGIRQNEVALLFVTGDLTWSGDAHEFENATCALQLLARKLGLHPSQVIIVPGNHDVEWRHDKVEIDENAELNYRNFVTSWYGIAALPSMLRVHRFVVDGRGLTVIGLNSCRIESKENAGLGFVGREQLGELMRFLQDSRGDADLKIALIHHHLKAVNFVEELDWATKRVSITLDAEGVIRTLMAAGVRLVLHGHQHQPFFSEERRIIDNYVDTFRGTVRKLDATIAIVGAGSIGVERAHLNIIGQNTYNVIDFGIDANHIEVRTRCRSSVGPGFIDHQRTTFSLYR
jgi:predicted MPP superfamily phosphohydrolase